jgi:hypothetical protein
MTAQLDCFPRTEVRGRNAMTPHRIFETSVASVYPHYVAKAEKKGRRRGEVDEIICWLTGYSTRELQGGDATLTNSRGATICAGPSTPQERCNMFTHCLAPHRREPRS